MSDYYVHLSPEVMDDLDDIWDYIAYELDNPISANKTTGSLLAAIDSLEQNANRGKNLYFHDGTFSGYQWILSGSYYVFYQVKQREVFVERVLYSGRDYLSILFP